MSASWVRSVDEGTGEIVMSNGRGFNLADIPGKNFPQARLNKITDEAQSLIDHRMRQSDLPLDDPERGMSAADFTAAYGGKRFLDGAAIVDRRSRVWFTHDGAKLVAHSEVVR